MWRKRMYRRAQIMELHLLGRSNRQVRDLLGTNRNTLATDQKALGIKLRNDTAGWQKPNPEATDRAEAMAAMYSAGKTLNEIGGLYGLTRERVRQILRKHTDVTADQGGASFKAKRRKKLKKQRAEADCLEKNGCTVAQLNTLRAMGREMMRQGAGRETTPVGAFVRQRLSAQNRGIEWNFKLWDWWQVWERSGKWSQRGRGKDCFVMCRFGDAGGYEPGNVYIATQSHNAKVQPNNPYRVDHPDHAEVAHEFGERTRNAIRKSKADLHRKHKGLPHGVTIQRGRFVAQITVNGRGKYLGSFGCPTLAGKAYREAVREISA